jgi:hypothetical protein
MVRGWPLLLSVMTGAGCAPAPGDDTLQVDARTGAGGSLPGDDAAAGAGGTDEVPWDGARDSARPTDAPPGEEDEPGDDAPSCGESPISSRWADWPMPDPTGTYPASTGYDTSAPDVVGDQLTHLVWQRNVPSESYTWAGAKSYCGCLALGGYDDWRLPTRIELVSIVDFTRHDPAVDTGAFPATPGEYFWTSSPLAENASSAWYLFFLDGNAHSIGVGNKYRVRCVRGGVSTPAQRYIVPDDGTVVDTATGLAWQRTVDGTARGWEEAQAYCAGLPQAGGGWRMPNMKELQTLIDETTVDPAIDRTVFPATASESFWSSSLLVGGPPEAWFVNFYSGVSYTNVKTNPYRVRCVRPLLAEAG